MEDIFGGRGEQHDRHDDDEELEGLDDELDDDEEEDDAPSNSLISMTSTMLEIMDGESPDCPECGTLDCPHTPQRIRTKLFRFLAKHNSELSRLLDLYFLTIRANCQPSEDIIAKIYSRAFRVAAGAQLAELHKKFQPAD